MKRYEFRMQKVLRVRRLQEDAARAAIAAARTAEQRASDAVAGSYDHYRALASDTSAASAMGFLGQRDQASYRATSVRLAEGNLRVAADATADAVSTWHVSHRRVEALERLDERRREEHGIEARRAEDTAVDEIVVARARARA
jgi:flagellar FliJ protein